MFQFNKTAITGSVDKSINKLAIRANTATGGTGTASGSFSGSGGNFNSGATFLGSDFSFHILEGLLNYTDPKIMNAIFREIYTMDNVSGPAVDLMAGLPWSDYSLVGITDDKVYDIYEKCLAELGIQKLMTSLYTCQQVLGRVIATLVFDKGRGIFTDTIIHDPDTIEVKPIPLAGYDPKVNVKLSADFRKFLNSKDERDMEALKEIPEELLSQFKSGGSIPLESIKTIYLSRTNLVGIDGLSLYHRILPIWIMEKALMRGTILASTRRQRSILHLTMGSDTWVPTDEQFASIAQLFANADRDPQGAIVATRPDISTNEVRGGTDFWKVTEDTDQFTNAKLRAMSLSESFLSGDATYSNAEQSMVVFMESLETQRYHMTNSVFRDKIFLLLAKYHGFRRRTEAELKHNIRYDEKSNNAKKDPKLESMAKLTGSRNLAEAASYLIPEIRWNKALKPTGNKEQFDIYKELQEAGLPIPLAVLASSGGVDLYNIMQSYESDIADRKSIKKYQEELAKIAPKKEEGGSGGDEDDFSFESSAKEDDWNVVRRITKGGIKEPVTAVRLSNNLDEKKSLLKVIANTLPKEYNLSREEAINILRNKNARQ